MNLLFVHDHPFRKVDGEIYSTGGLNDSVLGRYTKYCDRLIVIARIVEEESANDRWSLITQPKVRIFGNKTFRYPGLENKIQECDKMIVRLPSVLGIQALSINRKYNKPYFIEMVACAWDALWNHGVKGKVVAPYMFLKNRQLIKNAPYVLYVTQNFLQHRYPCSGKTLGCSDVEIVSLDEDIEKCRLAGLQEDKKVWKIGTVAAIDVPYKGQSFVIEALGKLKKRGNIRYEYYIVGNGSRKNLEVVARDCNVIDQVHFLGGMPHEKVFDWLDSIDLYIQPSKQEGLPRALVEAMSRGLPVLGSIAGGIPELVSEKYLFRKGDYIALADILENLEKEELIEMSKESFDRACGYQKSKLDKERDAFYKAFIEE